jgi:hypothetical protein
MPGDYSRRRRPLARNTPPADLTKASVTHTADIKALYRTNAVGGGA